MSPPTTESDQLPEGSLRTVRAGETIFQQGERGDSVYLIEAGQVAILRQTEKGEHLLAMLGVGGFFGEMSLLENEPHMASARATVETRLLVIDEPTFDQIVRSDPEVALHLLRGLSLRLRETSLANLPSTALPSTTAAPSPPPRDAAVSAAVRLVHEADQETFDLPDADEVTIGRCDERKGYTPDVDLSEVDAWHSTSRRHARILRRKGKYLLVEEEGVANGTLVNQVQIDSGAPVEINFGDQLQFGVVQLRFEQA